MRNLKLMKTGIQATLMKSEIEIFRRLISVPGTRRGNPNLWLLSLGTLTLGTRYAPPGSTYNHAK